MRALTSDLSHDIPPRITFSACFSIFSPSKSDKFLNYRRSNFFYKNKILYCSQDAVFTELALRAGDIVEVTKQDQDGWWHGVDSEGHRGLFPADFVERIEGFSSLTL